MNKFYPITNFLIIFILLFLAFTVQGKGKTTTKKKSINLASVSAAVFDYKTAASLYEKNSSVVMPIASITKLMTAMVVLDAKQSLKQKIRFTKADRRAINFYFSRIRTGSELSRADVMRIALMSSENLAASALGSNYPGGVKAIVKAMNKKAKSLGMKNTHFVDSTGLSDKNVSTTADLAKMVIAAAKYPLLKKYSTTQVYTARFKKPRYILGFTNTNRLIRSGDKNVKLSKTGYLDVAGRCLVMLTRVGNKDIVMVMLDSFGKRSPLGDVKRIKKWLKTGKQSRVAKSASNYASTKLAYYSAIKSKNTVQVQ
ncbi:MAG: D-alanyl-D-alanine endopeptidase [Pseudomonadota bacterium]